MSKTKTITSYKIVLTPDTEGEGDGKLIVLERSRSEVEPGFYGKLKSRQIENEELATWTKEQFTSRMSEYGYGFLVQMYLKDNDINFVDV